MAFGCKIDFFFSDKNIQKMTTVKKWLGREGMVVKKITLTQAAGKILIFFFFVFHNYTSIAIQHNLINNILQKLLLVIFNLYN